MPAPRRAQMPRPHLPEFRRRAIDFARERDKPIAVIPSDLGISESCLRNWLHPADVDEGRREGLTTDGRKAPLALTFAFIEAERANSPVRTLCSSFVSTSGYYDWREHLEHPAPRPTSNALVTETIRGIHHQSRGDKSRARLGDLRLL